MNITEATHVARTLRLIDGSHAGRLPEQVVESVEYLAPRCAKPLQIAINLDLDEVADTAAHLIQRQADREVAINLGTDREGAQ